MLSWPEYNKKWLAEDMFGYGLMVRKKRLECYEKYVKLEEDKMNSAPTPAAITSGSVNVVDGWFVYTDYISCPYETDSFGNITFAQPPCSKANFDWGLKTANKQEGNNPMNYATATVQAGTTETQDQRKYLSQRLEEIYWEKLRPLEAQFGLTDDERPQTPKELKQRIADGKFVIKGIKDADDEDEDDDDYFYGSWYHMLRWRDPAKKSDHDGYQAAVKELQTLRQKTLDIIKIDEPKSGLDAIKALEAWTPTGAAN